MSDIKNNVKNHFDKLAGSRDSWIRKNKYYHNIPTAKRISRAGVKLGV